MQSYALNKSRLSRSYGPMAHHAAMHMTTFIGGVVIERSATALECGFKFDMEGLDAGARRRTRELPAKP
ncbi:hypothetical protein E4U37_000432 [Claviceps purpurea]|nr:hypothetical protein E4U37_000432 [Claviceps purpurea]